MRFARRRTLHAAERVSTTSLSPRFGLLLAIGLWLGLGLALSRLTARVADWFVMTDELQYERLAISAARLDTPIPHIHTVAVSAINQLYPLLLAPVFRHGSVQHGFHDAHVLNAFVMASAAVPSYLLARRVTAGSWLPLVVAVASVVVPWMTLSSFLLTEVAAYPAFAWALLAMQAAISRPSPRSDALVLVALTLAVLARTQFYALAVVLPLALLADAAVSNRVRATLRSHALLLVVYAIGSLTVLALVATGHGILGSYAQTASGNPLPASIVRSAPAHLAIVALAGGLLPFLVGGAWLVSNARNSETPERLAFVWVAIVTIVVLTIEAASFDLRFGGGLVRERYLFYLTPLLLVAFAAALTAARLPRWSLGAPVVILALGFWQAPLPTFVKFNADTPASVLNDWLISTMHGTAGARTFLILAAAVLAVAFVEGSLLFGRLPLAVGLSTLLLVALPAETGYAFKRLFAVDGTSGLPLTLDQSVVFGWVDRQITTSSEAVMVPYPVIRDDYWANIGYWWDLEFWNKSVDREAGAPNQFSGTPPGTFPKIDLRFDPRTGRANYDLDSYVAQADDDVRFHVKGRFLHTERDVSITFPDRPWRADWVTYGLYPDGWTRPGVTARIRVFPDANQRGPVLRTLTVTLISPTEGRPVVLRSNTGTWTAAVGNATVTEHVTLCVPDARPADVTLRARGASAIGGDPSTIQSYGLPRQGGLLLSSVALASETDARCPPPSR